jgi:hypothetical protein
LLSFRVFPAIPISYRCLGLRGLNPEVSYTVRNLDAEAPARVSGRVLLEQGLTVTLADAPGAALIHCELDK